LFVGRKKAARRRLELPNQAGRASPWIGALKALRDKAFRRIHGDLIGMVAARDAKTVKALTDKALRDFKPKKTGRFRSTAARHRAGRKGPWLDAEFAAGLLGGMGWLGFARRMGWRRLANV